MQIVSLKDSEYSKFKNDIFSIFLAQSVYQNHSFEEQKAYYYKWVEIYYNHWPEWFFVAIEKEKILGYICACPQSKDALSLISFASYHLFKDKYDKYPVHFHVNVKPGNTGKGIGNSLLQALIQKGQLQQKSNLHILTSPQERNVSFYRKNQFQVVAEANLGDHPLLMMALDLGPSFSLSTDKNI